MTEISFLSLISLNKQQLELEECSINNEMHMSVTHALPQRKHIFSNMTCQSVELCATLWSLRADGSIEGKIKDKVTGGHCSLCRCQLSFPSHPHRSNSHIKLTEAHIAQSQLNSGLPLFHRLALNSFSRMSSNCSDEFFQATNHAEQTFRKMETYLQHKQLCDVLLIAGDHKIPAHR